MFGTILITACTLMHLYVFWRISATPLVRRRFSRETIFLGGMGLWILFILGRTIGHDGTGTAAGMLELAGMNWLAGSFLLFVSYLSLDLVTGFGFFFPRISPRLRNGAFAAGCLLSAIALVQGIRPPAMQSHTVHLSGLSEALDGAVVVALSDMHLGSQNGKTWLDARIAQVLAEQPDLIVLLGDIFEGHGGDRQGLIPTMAKLSAPLGVWAVLGNHDHHGSGESQTFMEAAGIGVLRNRWQEIGSGLSLAGVDDLTSHRRAGRNGDPVAEALKGRPAGPTILLSHSPLKIENAAAAGVNLMLSGHTHGGQVWPFGYLVRLVYPLLEGMHQVNGMPVIISRGTGTWGPRMRLWKRSEILRITLYRAQDQSPLI